MLKRGLTLKKVKLNVPNVTEQVNIKSPHSGGCINAKDVMVQAKQIGLQM